MRRLLNKFHRRSVLLATIAVVLVIAFASWWYLTSPARKTDLTIPSSSSNTKQPSNTSSSSKGQSATASAQSNTPPPSKSSPNAAPTNNNLPLTAPWGNFVSNHHPGEGGSPTTETSVCNTTPGASCYIKFTNGSLTRKLDAKTADSNGSVVWSWDVSNAGFTSGSWQVTAVASSGNQTKSVIDPQSLVIQ